MIDLERLRYTLEQMSEAATNLLRTEPEKVDIVWISAFIACIETTLDAIED